MRHYLGNIYLGLVTVITGMRITLKYLFAARDVNTVQYPDQKLEFAPRYRGFHTFDEDLCIACDLCAKACPVDCIYIEADTRGKNAQITRYAIDYSKCMFCALCCDPCPTDCIKMGKVHDLSGFSRETMVVEFTELTKQGLRTPKPLWAQKAEAGEGPAWIEQMMHEGKLENRPEPSAAAKKAAGLTK